MNVSDDDFTININEYIQMLFHEYTHKFEVLDVKDL